MEGTHDSSEPMSSGPRPSSSSRPQSLGFAVGSVWATRRAAGVGCLASTCCALQQDAERGCGDGTCGKGAVKLGVCIRVGINGGISFHIEDVLKSPPGGELCCCDDMKLVRGCEFMDPSDFKAHQGLHYACHDESLLQRECAANA
eukprot:1153730-Pelagomonas_calceolata.AAC.1